MKDVTSFKKHSNLYSIYTITYNTINEVIGDLQEFMNNLFKSEQTVCNYTNASEKLRCTSQRKTRIEVSQFYLLVEMLY